MARSDFREKLAIVDDLPAGMVITAERDESQELLGRVPQPADDAYVVTSAIASNSWRLAMTWLTRLPHKDRYGQTKTALRLGLPMYDASGFSTNAYFLGWSRNMPKCVVLSNELDRTGNQ